MCFSSPKIPAAPPPPPATPQVTPQDPSVLQRQDNERRRRAAALGTASTMSNGAAGIATPTTLGGKSLLGM